MIYQNIITGIDPYFVDHDVGKDFPPHVHYELEFIYVLEGKVCAVVDNTQYEVHAGEIICIDSMINHSYFDTPEKATTFLVEFGPAFIGEDFRQLTKTGFKCKIWNREGFPEIFDCFDQLIKSVDGNGAFANMMIKSLLYKLFVLVAESCASSPSTEVDNDVTKQRYMMSKVQSALNLVRHRYNDPLTINEAAAACGYGKSVFCKIFKNAVGVGFHQYLNAHRIEIAKYLLSETETPINCIADTIGYKDTKTFYRLFKTTMGVSPGEYRKKSRLPTMGC